MEKDIVDDQRMIRVIPRKTTDEYHVERDSYIGKILTKLDQISSVNALSSIDQEVSYKYREGELTAKEYHVLFYAIAEKFDKLEEE